MKRTFRSYTSMIERCYFQEGRKHWYKFDVCERWLKSFESFVEDMGPRPEGKTIDRIDNEKGYYPGNCRWATPTQQCRNRSITIVVEYEGEELPLIQLCENLGADYEIVRGRLKIGMSLDEALSQPRRFSWNRAKVDGEKVNVNAYYRQHKKRLDSLGLHPQSIRDRLRNGWDFDKAVSEPKREWTSERKDSYRKSKRYKS